MNYVLTDYVPKISKAALAPARGALMGVTALSILGLVKLNLEGPGVTGTLKSLWRGAK